MPKIFVSSTSRDLKAHREAVINALNAMKQNFTAMEYYIAQDSSPAEVCVRDVKDSDIYVGIFAWRYGSTVLYGDPPQLVAITELEYRAAEEKTRLIFLLDEDATWPNEYKDAVSGESNKGEQIYKLRKELTQRHVVKFFTSPDVLALQVTLSLFKELSIDKPKKFDLPEHLTEVRDIQQFGSSLLPEIVEKVRQASKDIAGAKFMEVNLGEGESWWSTRLYLLASLAADFTQVRRIIFVDGNDRFIGMASPFSVKRALLAAQWSLQPLYRESIYFDDKESAIVSAIMNFRQELNNVGIQEPELKVFVTMPWLKQCLHSCLEEAAVSTGIEAEQNAFIAYEVIKEPSEFVAIVKENNQLLGVVDRLELSARIAKTELARHINQALKQAARA
jgi:hypothetical protein